MKILVLFFLIVVAVLLGGVYGGIHDQWMYTICPEFFTKMRFEQLGIKEVSSVRWSVFKIGFANAWSIGLSLGLLLAFTGLLHKDYKKMMRFTLQSFFISLAVAAFFGITAYFFASGNNVVTMEGIADVAGYSKVISINNYSRVGGVIGMFIGLAWQVYQTKKL